MPRSVSQRIQVTDDELAAPDEFGHEGRRADHVRRGVGPGPPVMSIRCGGEGFGAGADAEGLDLGTL